MEVDRNKLEELANDYEITYAKVKSYCDILSQVPCVSKGNEDMLYECLETVLQDVKTNEFIKSEKEKEGTFDEDTIKPLSYIISDSLYRVYQEDSIPYLSSEYKEINKTRYRF